jgi:DNA processing protein
MTALSSAVFLIMHAPRSGVRRMSDAQRAWLILAAAYVRVDEYLGLHEAFGKAESVVRQPVARLRSAGLAESKAAAIAAPDRQLVERSVAWLAGTRRQLVTVDDDSFPELLRRIPDPPLVLFLSGDVDVLHLPALAIVGSRNPTEGGRRNAYEFARHLAAAGFTIVSGLAEGIDAAAHEGALAAGGHTAAFLGHGIDRVYPAANRQLAGRIAATGALASEYPIGVPPDRRHFPERNRLISGVTLGTLVVEAARRSGSLITARLAAEQGREVFALPGSIHNALARGCHKLIREGAKLVEAASDIVCELGPVTGHVLQSHLDSKAKPPIPASEDDEYVELRRVLSHDPTSIDDLASRSGLTIGQVSSMLLILELNGEVESLSGGRYSLAV